MLWGAFRDLRSAYFTFNMVFGFRDGERDNDDVIGRLGMREGQKGGIGDR